jgi:hypothetical protein
VFPGSELVWRAIYGDVSRDLIGKFIVFASLRDDVKDGTTVNIEDGRWEKDWSEICKWFRLKAVGPRSGALTGKAWVMANKGRWEGVGEGERTEGGNTGGE